MVEHGIRNAGVRSSSLLEGTILHPLYPPVMSSKGCSLSVDGDNSVCDPHDYTTHVHVLMDVEKYELGGLEKLQGSSNLFASVFSSPSVFL